MQAKVVGAMLGGAFATIVIWLLNTYTGANVPGEVGAALTTIFGTGIAWMVSETGVNIPVVPSVAGLSSPVPIKTEEEGPPF